MVEPVPVVAIVHVVVQAHPVAVAQPLILLVVAHASLPARDGQRLFLIVGLLHGCQVLLLHLQRDGKASNCNEW